MNKTNNNIPKTKTSSSWNTYWKGTSDVGAFTLGGVSHPALKSFWDSFFNDVKSVYEKPKILDIASGNGAVIQCALDQFSDRPIDLYSLDISEAAGENIKLRFPVVKCITASACTIPKESKSIEIVTSQFGVEYAGFEAILEGARVVKDGGVLAFMLHCDSGYIHQECQQNLDAINKVLESQFIQLAIELFTSGFDLLAGGDREVYEHAAKKLAPAVAELENIMRQYGTQVAGDTICKLYNDVGDIHSRIQHYESQDVLNWLNKMEQELISYSERMSSMNESTITSQQFEQIKIDLASEGFDLETADRLFAPDNKFPMAWVVVAKRLPS